MEKNDDMKEFPEVTTAVTKDVGDVENAGARHHTKRGLTSRQVQFLALGMLLSATTIIPPLTIMQVVPSVLVCLSEVEPPFQLSVLPRC
jgi:hypothetical protein